MIEETVTTRFLRAYVELLDIGATVRTRFCADVGADRRNFEKLLKNPDRHLLRPEWLGGIVLHYGVSADWLLTGRGVMFGQ
jgi:hypothetical protein